MRAQRAVSEAEIYHVISRGTGRQLIFECDGDRERYLALLGRAARQRQAVLYAWCLMGNHVHVLVRAPLERLSAMMRELNSSYAIWFNAKSGRVGHLFQGRFKSEPVDSDAYLRQNLRPPVS